MSAGLVDKIWTIITYVFALIVGLMLAFMLYKILSNGWGFWDWKFLTGNPSGTTAGGGIGPQLFNSFYVLVLTLVISIPISLGAAIYLAEYAKPGRVTDFIRLCMETL